MFAKVHEVEVGTILVADGGFTCLRDGERRTVVTDANGDLAIACDAGFHTIDGQLDDGDEYIGLSLA
jgi:hypothetical protein